MMRLLGSMSPSVRFTENTKCPSREQSAGTGYVTNGPRPLHQPFPCSFLTIESVVAGRVSGVIAASEFGADLDGNVPFPTVHSQSSFGVTDSRERCTTHVLVSRHGQLC